MLKTAQSAPKSTSATSPAVTPNPIPHQSTAVDFRPLDLAWNEVGIYPLLTALLAVVGVYFTFWLSRGGAEQIGQYFK